jgi:hypothetical protein
LLGAHFETYEPFITLILNFFSGCGKLQIAETTNTDSAHKGARLYHKNHNTQYIKGKKKRERMKEKKSNHKPTNTRYLALQILPPLEIYIT